MKSSFSNPPEGIIITISLEMLRERGCINWLRNFLWAMEQPDCIYSMRLGAKPKFDLLYVYLCIDGKVRYRAYFVGSDGPCEKTFSDGRTMFARAWVEMCGPVQRPDKPISMKGFRGFRYTEKLF